MPRTRLAPSPTGALHLGNARTFLANWALARQQGWQIVLRIEDLDGPRVKASAAAQAIDILAWLGIDWDEGPYYQRSDLAPYWAALAQLADQGDIYPCQCTRREIEAAALSAPHGDEHELRYPGTCRPRPSTRGMAHEDLGQRLRLQFNRPPSPPEGASPAERADGAAWRLQAPEGATAFVDLFAGRHEHDIQATTGDFLVATKEGLPSYQLAVVVDDARQEIDRVVRGDDLLGSTHRQLLVQRRMGLGSPPEYYHLPLVVGPDGRRLAKRHGDSRVERYRSHGVGAERIVGLIAEWCGLGDRREMTAAAFREIFDAALIPRRPIVYSPEDDAWLMQSG